MYRVYDSLMYLQLRMEATAALSVVNYTILICSDNKISFPTSYFLIRTRDRGCYCRELTCQKVGFRLERWANRVHSVFLGFARLFVEQAISYFPNLAQILLWWLVRRFSVLRWKYTFLVVQSRYVQIAMENASSSSTGESVSHKTVTAYFWDCNSSST